MGLALSKWMIACVAMAVAVGCAVHEPLEGGGAVVGDDSAREENLAAGLGQDAGQGERTYCDVERSPEESRRLIAEYMRRSFIPEAEVDETFSPCDLDEACEMLLDPDYRAYFHALGAIVAGAAKRGDKNLGVSTLREFIERPEPKNNRGEPFFERCIVLKYLGWIGDDDAVSLLRHTMDYNGARELSREWFHLLRDDEVSFTMGYMRGNAAIGLVWTRDPENVALVEAEYSRLRSIKPTEGEDRQFYGDLAEALALRDALISHGEEIYLGTLREPPNIIDQYFVRYYYN